MGMYDYLIINTDKLPIAKKDKELLGENPKWQTKDFDCILSSAEITDDGLLRFRRFESYWDKNAVSGFSKATGIKGALCEKNHRWEDIPMHGFVNFYTHDKNNEWWEFYAKFTDGKLVEITGGKEERTGNPMVGKN